MQGGPCPRTRGFGPDDQMWLSLPAFLALRQGIAGGLKIISRNDDGLLYGQIGKVSDSPLCSPLFNDDLVFVRVRLRAAPQEKECLSRTLLMGRDQLGGNQVAHGFALMGEISLASCSGYNRDTFIIFAALPGHNENYRHVPHP